MSPRRVVMALVLCTTLCLPLAGLAHNCSVNASPLDFGVYDTESPAPLEVNGTIQARCSGNVFFATFRLSPGSSGDALNRELVSTNGVLAYNLYTDPARTRIWGDGTGGTGLVWRIAFRGQRRWDIPVYGRIFAGQDPWPGSYADSIVVTVTF
jgi:spore coat protein U-like protein